VKLCWFTTGREREDLTLLKDVWEAMEENAIGYKITLVFLNSERGESPESDELIAFAEAEGIPVETLSSGRFSENQGLTPDERRKLFDSRVMAIIGKHDCNCILLAGYTPILSSVLLGHLPALGLHPSLPGACKGKREQVITKTIDKGIRTFGAMVHLVDESILGGQPVSFVKLELEGRGFEEFFNNAFRGDRTSFDHLFKFMRQAGSAAEAPLLIETLSLLAKGDITAVDGKVLSNGEPVPGGIDMTDRVLAVLKAKSSLSAEA